MKHTLLILLLMLSVLAEAQIVNIPDNEFKGYLLFSATTNNIAKDVNGISIKIDANADSEIQQSEALAVYQLKIDNSTIVDLTGISYFSNLTSLDCSFNDLSTLDVGMLNSLTYLDCNFNALTSINVSNLANLEVLYCGVNNLATIDLSGCVGLTDLRVSDNNISVLNLDDVTDLTFLEFSNNQVASIDLTMYPNLTSLYAADNLLTTVDVSNQHNLQNLAINNNQLTSVFMKNGSNEMLGETSFANNPNLSFICADEEELAAVEAALAGMGLDDASASSYCSFTPGGDFNTITGTLTFDAASDGCDAGDATQSFIKVNITEGSETGSTFTGVDGGYNFYTQDGNFTIAPEFENDWFTASPASAVVDFPVVDNSVETANFCITPNGVHNDVEVVMVPIVPAQPGSNAVYKLVYKNKGNQVLSGNVTCQWDYGVLFPVSMTPTPNTGGSGIYSWNYSNLQPFENREILMTLNVNTPTDIPAVNVGDVLDIVAQATLTGSDDLPADNTFLLEQEVVGSYDPNNITCIEGETASPDSIGDYLHYVVNFKNTGNAQAGFVVVKHDIDPSQFDITSLQILNSSHTVEARIRGNRIEFMFQAINLNAGDHGNILFKLKSHNTLQAGDNVVNSANIYFDYNFPVPTNDATTTFETLSRGDFTMDNSVKVYPNPSNGVVNIEADGNILSFELYDVQGRLLQSSALNEVSGQVDISQRAGGMYFLKIKTEKGVKVEKLVRE